MGGGEEARRDELASWGGSSCTVKPLGGCGKKNLANTTVFYTIAVVSNQARPPPMIRGSLKTLIQNCRW